MIRRTLLAILGLALTIGGLGFFGYTFLSTAGPSFGPPSSIEKALTVASPVFGIALDAAGIWLVRPSLSRGEPH
jgi:hypothetical protein